MATKKRGGLGRGIGALIPQTSEGERPVDVFFPNRTAAQVAEETAARDAGEGIATPATDESTEGSELREVPGAKLTRLRLSDTCRTACSPAPSSTKRRSKS